MTNPASTALPEVRPPRWKRGFDLAFIVVSSPVWSVLFLCIGLWIRLSSRGPIFYRQERIGYREQPFSMFKFRSMKVDADQGTHDAHVEELMQSGRPLTKLDSIGDTRLIPGGAILRASGLDELAQLINVLRGEMSIVGPRPCTSFEHQRYQGNQLERFNAPPGITGYWQVNGKNKTTFPEMNAMDIHYTRTLSPLLDLTIAAQTLPAMLQQLLQWLENRRHQRALAAVGAPDDADPCQHEPK